MNSREDLFYRVSEALETSAMASDEQQAADEGVGTPEAAASVHWNAASLCRAIGERFEALAESHTFAAKRMDMEQRRERATGREYRLTNGDAA